MHGENPTEETSPENEFGLPSYPQAQPVRWKTDIDGNISCPTKDFGGCSSSLLELKCIFSKDWLLSLESQAKELMTSLKFFQRYNLNGNVKTKCTCANTENSRKASSRKNSHDNYLYCPFSNDINKEDIMHFQGHWAKAEPVIVRGVVDEASHLIWEPSFIWSAIDRDNASIELSSMKAIDCLACCEVSSEDHFKILYIHVYCNLLE